ncbi:MAG: M20/M25/M40 family metallo-hydrolase [Alphaproteobacteria bacterium]|nr:M20/M25/M40 family metallo-hydrolase [Alphaproteobacteria bacterium]
MTLPAETTSTFPSPSAALAAALDHAARNEQRSVDALGTLVRIPSLTGEEGAAQEHVASLLRAIGAEVTAAEPDVEAMFARFPDIAQYPTHWQHDLILPYEELPTAQALKDSGLENVLNYKGRPNVVGVVRGSGGGRSLILNGHIDTVTVEPTGAWTRDPFGAEIADGRMYGRGTSDMKGGLMAALLALTYLKESGIVLRGDVVFQSVVNEEHAGNGTLDLVRRGITADAAIVLEPTENQIFVSHPGGLYWQVSIPGVSRSPGARWQDGVQDGVSAIEKLPAVIDALLDVERECNRIAPNDPAEQGRAAFSLVMGKIVGGHYETVTAAEVVIKGGAYFSHRAGSVQDVMRRFRQAIAQPNKRDPFLSRQPAKLAFLHHDDSTVQSPDIPVASEMSATLARRGAASAVRHGPFCCDMRHLVNQGGIPGIVFGPGTIAQAHKPDEHIPVAEYLAAIGHLMEFIYHWCNADGGAAAAAPRF